MRKSNLCCGCHIAPPGIYKHPRTCNVDLLRGLVLFYLSVSYYTQDLISSRTSEVLTLKLASKRNIFARYCRGRLPSTDLSQAIYCRDHQQDTVHFKYKNKKFNCLQYAFVPLGATKSCTVGLKMDHSC